VRLNNFGREEALFAVNVIDTVIGPRFFSLKRITIVIAVCSLLFFSMLLYFAISARSYELYSNQFIRIFLIFAVIFFACSLSFTRFYSMTIAHLCGQGAARNFVIFMASLVIAYGLIVFTGPLARSFAFGIAYGAAGNVRVQDENVLSACIRNFEYMWSISTPEYLNPFSTIGKVFLDNNNPVIIATTYGFSALISLVPGLVRLVITAIFIGSYLLRPIYIPFSVLLARIIESEKPIFALVFGAVAAIAKSIGWLVKNS
jgi:hypothetical protein